MATTPLLRKFVPNVTLNDETPLVVITNVVSDPVTPPLAFSVQFPVGTKVLTESFIGTVIVPVVAGVAVVERTWRSDVA